MKPEWDKFWSKLFNTIHTQCEHEASIANGFINNLSHSSKVLLLTGSLVLPFQKFTNDVIWRFVAVSVHKVIKIRNRLVEKGKIKLGGSSACFSALARRSLDANLSLHHLLTLLIYYVQSSSPVLCQAEPTHTTSTFYIFFAIICNYPCCK